MELVVGASEATMKSLLGKLGGLLAQEYSLIRGVRGDIQYISDELASMQAFLRDLSSAPEGQDNRMKDWMKQIRDMAYDCEDCIDDFAHRLPNEPVVSDFTCSWIVIGIYELWTWWPRREIASKIVDLKVRAQQIAERRSRYGVNNPDHNTSNRPGVRAATYDIAEHQVAARQLIGMKEPVGVATDMDKLEKWLSKTDPNERAVLSIVGFGGVGKTTIATALYRNVRNEFECRASVTVSQNYDQDAVMRSILNQVMPQDTDQKQQGSEPGTPEDKTLVAQIRKKLNRVVLPLIQIHRQQCNDGSSDVKPIKIETMDHDELVNELKKQLADKRYLLLIDDIWSAKTWESIRICLPEENNRGSRIIVTSRFQAVGATCSPDKIDLLHTADFLTGDESKRLFVQGVSESKSSKNNEIVQNHVPEEIWKICGGLPLAIVTMAGLVACNPSKHSNDWKKVCKSLFPEPVTSLTLDGVTRILDCCYNDLPADLKTCSLYLSIFPKGWKISRKRLTRRWIAEGFVSEKQGLTEEEVAETYFNQLTRRKIIRPVEHSSNGKVKTFQVHDMVLEYIVSKSNEENFITVVGGHWMMPAPSNKVRRLSMQSSGSKSGNSTKGMNLSQVRSLTIFGSLNQLPFHSFNNAIIQVLDLEGWKGLKEKHLKDICNMLVLKYLGLRRTEIAKIPSKIEKLEYLEALDIRETNVRELPKAVGQLKRISSILGGNKNPRKGLRLSQEKSKDPRKSMLPQEKSKDGMKALRVLSGIEIIGESTAVAGLHQLTGLRKFAIYKLSINKDGDTFKELRSSIEYLGSCGLQTLAINDEGSDFINSLDTKSAPPRYLIALELSGMLERPPQWMSKLHMLNKLTLSLTVLRTDTLELICALPSLFSLTFSLNAVNLDEDTQEILEKNKEQSDGEIFVPGGFPSLKLLRFFAPLVPKLGFSDNAMPSLEMIDMRFCAFEGLLGIDTLENLKEVHLRVNDQADETTKFFVDDLKNNGHGLKVIVDHVVTA
ncbi:hypothetical protein BDA96_05G235200 [Sorghum bicolor]|uniref:Disease resistance protein RPM1 n=1 Tax=Sorghum bicolor TaxID=4558 RepID=A0A921R0I0_SORBI|nr:hypothetical protein BDA96_05G235200 [Sorghum bicolor]